MDSLDKKSKLSRRNVLLGGAAAAGAVALEKHATAGVVHSGKEGEEEQSDRAQLYELLDAFYEDPINDSDREFAVKGDKGEFYKNLFEAAYAVRSVQGKKSLVEAVADQAFKQQVMERLKKNSVELNGGDGRVMTFWIMIEDLQSFAKDQLEK